MSEYIKVRESNQEKGEVEKKCETLKKWLNSDHESENHTVDAC